jgi:hypothetical protein
VNRTLPLILLALPLGCRGTFDLGQYITEGGSGEESSADTVHATSDASETRTDESSTGTDTNTEADTNTDTDIECSIETTDIGIACIGILQTLEGTNSPTDIEVGEFSGDDLPDLLIAGVQALSYYGGIGGGQFGGLNPIVSATGPGLASIDWNDDGRRDFAAIKDTQFQLFLSNGGGVFTPDSTTTLGGYDGVFGDFNQDGNMDIFLSGPLVQGFLNTNGTLMQAYDLGFESEGITTGQLDEDDYPDLVFAMPTMDQITVILTLPEWNFSSVIQAPLPLAADVAVANIDGVPGDELIAVGGEDGVLFLGRVQGAAIVELVQLPVGGLPRAVAVGDIDGDSMIDAAVGNASTHDVSLLLNEGVLLTNEIRLPVDNPNDSPESIVVADLDGDGQAEIIVGMISSNRVLVYGAM